MDIAKRRRLAAFYTPDDLAINLGKWIAEAEPRRVLEPSAGAGALVDALLEQGDSTAALPHVVACDLDPGAIEQLRERFGSSVELWHSDFLDIDPDAVEKFDAVIANPPFIRHHDLAAEVRSELRKRFHVQGVPGLWVYFLLHAVSFLREGGRMAAIVPASVAFTSYGSTLIARLQERFHKVTIERIEHRPSWVGGAEERGAIVYAEGARGMSSVDRAHSSDGRDKNRATQPAASGGPLPKLLRSSSTLGALAKLRIGVVTGRNKYFLLSEQQRKDLDIPRSHLTLAVSRGRQITTSRIGKSELLAARGDAVWLLTPKSDRHVAVARYLELMPAEDIASTSWLARREPWWRVDVGDQCDAILTYMNHYGPRISMVEDGITCTNTLHRLYFNAGSTKTLRIASVLTLLSTYGQLVAERIGRSYGGGVLKFEIGEAKMLPVLKVERRMSLSALDQIDAALLSGGLATAGDCADELLMPAFLGAKWRSHIASMKEELEAQRQKRFRGGRSSG